MRLRVLRWRPILRSTDTFASPTLNVVSGCSTGQVSERLGCVSNGKQQAQQRGRGRGSDMWTQDFGCKLMGMVST